MADVKITLEAATKEFTAAMVESQKAAVELGKQLESLKKSNETLVKSSKEAAHAATESAKATTSAASGIKDFIPGTLGLATAIGFAVTAFQALYDAAKTAASFTKQAFVSGVENIDNFQKATIGTAAAITNIADKSSMAGMTYKEVFQKNLESTQQTFVELEKLSSKYFASAIDLQLAYNTFAQRGIVIRRSELPLLAALTSEILLLTQGQQSEIQVQEEIRSLINGNMRTTAQLSQLIKAYGGDVKAIGDQIRATGSLKPLENVLVGAEAASSEIQKTFTAAKNGLETTIRQISRLGLDQFYAQIVGQIKDFTRFLNENKVQIVGLLAAIGKASGDVLADIGLATEKLLGFDNKTKDSNLGFISFLSVVETAIEGMIAGIQTLINLFGLLPPVIKGISRMFTGAFEVDPAIKQLKEMQAVLEDNIERNRTIENDEKETVGQRKIATAMVAEYGKQLEVVNRTLVETYHASTGILGHIRDVLFTTTGNLPAAISKSKEEIHDWGKIIQDEIAKVQLAMQPTVNFLGNVRGRYAANFQENLGAFKTGQFIAQNQLNQPEQPEQKTKATFLLRPEDIQAQAHLIDELVSATTRWHRAVRTSSETLAASEIDANLVALSRDAQLTAAGFDHIGTAILGLKTIANETTQFISNNIQAFVTGAQADFDELTDAVTNVIAGNSQQQFATLDKQLKVAEDGYHHFTNVAHQANLDLQKTEVDIHKDTAAQIKAEADKTFRDQTDQAQLLVTQAHEEVELAKQSGNERRLQNAQVRLANELQRRDETVRIALLEQEKKHTQAIIEQRIAAANLGKLNAQEDTQVVTEGLKLEKERLKVLQDQATIVGKIYTDAQAALSKGNQELINAKRELPRTDLESGKAAIQEVNARFSADIGDLQGKLKTLGDRLFALAGSAEGLDTSLIGNVLDIQALIAQLEDLRDKWKKAAEEARKFKTSDAAIANAVRSTVDGIAQALTDSFEGKRTDFVKLFKGISDNLVKDGLKDMIQKVGSGLQKAFHSLAQSVAPGLEEALGPAFLVGFGLLASFLLGQLMQKNTSSATAGNPQVGIQSTEQVRGLIGGETQIPIGQIGESLQNALVPTNLLLARIARAVEGGLGGGLSSSAINQMITMQINDTLQTQGG